MTDYERVEKVIRYLEAHCRQQPRLEKLARVAGLSESHFHRLFSRWAGTTPKAFLKALTAAHAKQLLRESKDLLNVSLEAGLSGPGRLHDLLVTVEGVTPGEFKARGAGLEIRYGFHATDFGKCLIGVTARGICHLAFTDEKQQKSAFSELEEKWPNASLKLDSRVTARVVSQVFIPKRKNRISVFVSGSPFQLKVWEALLRIPAGQVSSYGDVAVSVGRQGACRAVGTAVGANPIAFLIPCHRVIRG